MDRQRTPRARPAWCGLALAAALAAAGCGGSGIYPVDGKVTWKDGSPAKELEGALVVFDLPEKQTTARGSVRSDGSFKLTTKTDGDGALAGDYKVLIIERRLAGGTPDDPGAMAPGHMDVRYSDPRTTDLTATVKPGSNPVTLTVERNKPKK
jgi:hypothetical protein